MRPAGGGGRSIPSRTRDAHGDGEGGGTARTEEAAMLVVQLAQRLTQGASEVRIGRGDGGRTLLPLLTRGGAAVEAGGVERARRVLPRGDRDPLVIDDEAAPRSEQSALDDSERQVGLSGGHHRRRHHLPASSSARWPACWPSERQARPRATLSFPGHTHGLGVLRGPARGRALNTDGRAPWPCAAAQDRSRDGARSP